MMVANVEMCCRWLDVERVPVALAVPEHESVACKPASCCQ